MISRAAFQQPLPYFVLVGAAVFLLDAWLRHGESTIELNGDIQREVVGEFKTEFDRSPTPEEQQQALESWVNTELLYREASRLGLEDNDAVIRAHLANKLKQLVRERTILAPPTDEELRAQLEAHPERYEKADAFNVSHAFVNRNLAADSFEARASDAWLKLNAAAPLESIGDHFPRGPSFQGMTRAQLEAVLSVDLGAVLENDQVGKWHRLSGPRGAHFVRLDAVVSGSPSVESARAALAADVEARKRDAAVQEFVNALKKEYSVVDGKRP